MTNTSRKSRKLRDRIKGLDATPRLTSHPAPLFAGPWKQALQGADATPSARRTVLLQHSGGGDSWLVHNLPPGDPLQNYPAVGVWRTVARTRCTLAPGCVLEARIIAVRSGMTQKYILSPPGWVAAGAHGRLRITVNYSNLNGDSAVAVAEVDLPSSPEIDGAEPITVAGGSWAHLLFKYVKIIAPAEVVAKDPAALAKWSEDTRITVTIEHEGGARVIQCAVTEVPSDYVIDHDNPDASIHCWESTDPATVRPQTKAADGADFQELRFGTTHGLAVAARQAAQLGPIIAQWTSYAETLAAVTDTEPAPAASSSLTPEGLSVGSAFTSWSTDAPGYAIAGHYARRNPENFATRLSGAAVIPVRVWAEVRWSGGGTNTGYIRFQSTDRSWVTLTISQALVGTTWTEVEITGFLESMVAPDDPWPNLMDFIWVTGGTLEARYWAVEWGDKTVAA